MADIQDFGEKIGGARKDLWAMRGLLTTDIAEMNDMERKTHIKKDNIWLKPNWEQKVAEGTPQSVAYWQNKMRQSVPPRPPKDDEISQQNYVKVVGQIRDMVMAVKEPWEIDQFYLKQLFPAFLSKHGGSRYVDVVPEANGVINNKVLGAAQSTQRRMAEEAKKKLFGIPKDERVYVETKNSLEVYQLREDQATLGKDPYSEDANMLTIKNGFSKTYVYLRKNNEFHDINKWESGTFFVFNARRHTPVRINFQTREAAQEFVESFAKASQIAADSYAEKKTEKDGPKRKGAFTPPQLQHVKRTGPSYRGVRQAESDMFLEDLKFRGGEFGNWLNDNDRQTSLNMAYDALRDLSRVLHIRPEDLSFGQSLAIAFGARGTGGKNAGSAHYEEARRVINLTKMSGAGCLAHEWAHALDHAMGKSFGVSGFASEHNSSSIPASLRDVLDTLRYKRVMVQPEDISDELSEKIKQLKSNLMGWINHSKPANMPEELAATWNDIVQEILSSTHSFTGREYVQWRRGDEIVTHPQVEILSKIRKSVTNHVIPRESKYQICLWAKMLSSLEQEAQNAKPKERVVKTDFYKGSIKFDDVYSKAGHGYWQSIIEMFARAFDCYIADKLKEEGCRSDYLTAKADAFFMPDGNGGTIYAIPRGEERTLINEKFDLLVEDLKTRGILHEHTEVLDLTPKEEVRTRPSIHKPFTKATFSDSPEQYEQMSFDSLLFSAQTRAQEQQNFKSNTNKPLNFER